MKTAYDILLKPVISEQAMEQGDLKKYVFIVARDANKIEIRKAVEEAFGVKVAKVTTTHVRGKQRRNGAYPAGTTAARKKAVVRLTEDSKTIEFFEGMV